MEELISDVYFLVDIPFSDLVALMAEWIGIFVFGFCLIHVVIWAVVQLVNMFKNITTS